MKKLLDITDRSTLNTAALREAAADAINGGYSTVFAGDLTELLKAGNDGAEKVMERLTQARATVIWACRELKMEDEDTATQQAGFADVREQLVRVRVTPNAAANKRYEEIAVHQRQRFHRIHGQIAAYLVRIGETLAAQAASEADVQPVVESGGTDDEELYELTAEEVADLMDTDDNPEPVDPREFDGVEEIPAGQGGGGLIRTAEQRAALPPRSTGRSGSTGQTAGRKPWFFQRWGAGIAKYVRSFRENRRAASEDRTAKKETAKKKKVTKAKKAKAAAGKKRRDDRWKETVRKTNARAAAGEEGTRKKAAKKKKGVKKKKKGNQEEG